MILQYIQHKDDSVTFFKKVKPIFYCKRNAAVWKGSDVRNFSEASTIYNFYHAAAPVFVSSFQSALGDLSL